MACEAWGGGRDGSCCACRVSEILKEEFVGLLEISEEGTWEMPGTVSFMISVS